MITIQKYIQPQSLEEAYELNQSKSSRIIGGMLWLKMGSGNVGTAIDLCRLGLDAIEESGEEFSIGAMVSLRELELHTGLNHYTDNAMAEALESIVGVQFRNMATIGGSIWGRYGFSDVLTVFMALDSYVELYKGGVIPLADFASMKSDRDILKRIIVKKKPVKIAYRSMRIQRTDFPVITCAISCIEGRYQGCIGARPGKAVIIRDEQDILKGGITSESAGAFAGYLADNITTGSNTRGSAAYRTHLIRVLAERAVTSLGGGQ